jgi:hypothetical protein
MQRDGFAEPHPPRHQVCHPHELPRTNAARAGGSAVGQSRSRSVLFVGTFGRADVWTCGPYGRGFVRTGS